MITEELKQLKNKFYNSELTVTEMIDFLTEVRMLTDDFEIFIVDILKNNDSKNKTIIEESKNK